MKIKKIIGGFLVASPFLAMIAVAIYDECVRIVLLAFLIVAIVYGILTLGFKLLEEVE